ncbi:unnamed protein product [Cyclocybe aegerita]|uniref:F-box domain-containing protein n=1 Tax=Cyclocybe aegerita TaxID=1973307 RepID=A0A8S0WHR7_CYCAE|nr:unnamed protein product [Cyclocybe aegerita]
MALYTTQEELEALVSDYRRDLERKELQRQKSLKGRPSLIQQVPPEVLLEVFSILVNNDSRNMVFPSHVCRLWRGLITESSSLWTCIALGHYNEDKEAVFAYLQTVVSRAGPRQLSLSIYPDSKFLTACELLKIVLKVAENAEWCSLCYESYKIDEFVPYFDGSANVAHVRSLSLICRVRDFGIFELDLPGGVVDMQPFVQLRSLTLEFLQQVRTANVLAPWDQLTALNLGAYMDSLRYLTILRSCVNLETCRLCPDTNDDMQKISHEELERDPIQLTQLKRLHLTTYRVPALIPWNLQCPALQDATFDYDENDDNDECCELISFIRSCGTTLQKMQLPGIATDYFHEMQDDLKVLERLTISGPFGSPDIDELSKKEIYTAGIRFFSGISLISPRLFLD